jgi:uncharacterized protein YcfL
MRLLMTLLLAALLLVGCTEEERNKLFKEADNILGKDNGKIVRTWTVRDGKVTTNKNPDGSSSGYYYFWSEETGYVQIPVLRTIIEEIKK